MANRVSCRVYKLVSHRGRFTCRYAVLGARVDDRLQHIVKLIQPDVVLDSLLDERIVLGTDDRLVNMALLLLHQYLRNEHAHKYYISGCVHYIGHTTHPLLGGQILLRLVDLIAQRGLLAVQSLHLGADRQHRIAVRGVTALVAEATVVVPGTAGRITPSTDRKVLCL